jgi:hypothetical protein
MEFYLCVSLERLATFVLSIPEGVVERRTAVHPVRAFTSIGRDCVGYFVDTWKGDCLGSSSCGQRRGALPLHQVTLRQFIKFADPTRRSGHYNLLHVLPRRVHFTSRTESSLGGGTPTCTVAARAPPEGTSAAIEDRPNRTHFHHRK